jgi:hypothetical protein
MVEAAVKKLTSLDRSTAQLTRDDRPNKPRPSTIAPSEPSLRLAVRRTQLIDIAPSFATEEVQPGTVHRILIFLGRTSSVSTVWGRFRCGAAGRDPRGARHESGQRTGRPFNDAQMLT